MSLLEKLKEYCVSKDWGNSIETVYEVLSENRIYGEQIDSRRWWDEYFGVAKVDGNLYGFEYAETTGDNSPREVGWEFDENTICLAESYEVVETKYRKVDSK